MIVVAGLISCTAILIWRIAYLLELRSAVDAGTVSTSLISKASTIDGFYLVALLGTGIAFMVWLSSKVREYEPISTGRWFMYLIPIVNVVTLCVAVWNLYQEAGSNLSPRVMKLIIVAWAVLLTAGSIAWRINTTQHLQTLAEIQRYINVGIAADSALVVAGVLCVIIVYQVGASRPKRDHLPPLPPASMKAEIENAT